MNLDEKLKYGNPSKYESLLEIKKACEKIWKNKLMNWFTNHDVEHSEEVIYLMGQILHPIIEIPDFINSQELFILLASAYLHDIGMQYLKYDELSLDKLTETQYDYFRKTHAALSYNIILKDTEPFLGRDDIHLPAIDEEYLTAIALVSKGHSTEYFKEVIDELTNDSPTPDNRPIKAKLLTALLLIADELDLQSKRINFNEAGKFTLSDYSKVHWYKHHYVKTVNVRDGVVYLDLRFPENSDEYENLFKELIETKLIEQIKIVNPILKSETKRLLHIDIEIKTTCKVDKSKRPLPYEVLIELKKILKKSHTPAEKELSYDEIKKVLISRRINCKKEVYNNDTDTVYDLLTLFYTNKNMLEHGVSNELVENESQQFIYYSIGVELINLGLTSIQQVSNVKWTKILITKKGLKFLEKYELELEEQHIRIISQEKHYVTAMTQDNHDISIAELAVNNVEYLTNNLDLVSSEINLGSAQLAVTLALKLVVELNKLTSEYKVLMSRLDYANSKIIQSMDEIEVNQK